MMFVEGLLSFLFWGFVFLPVICSGAKRENLFSTVPGCSQNYAARGVYRTENTRSLAECATLCQNDARCMSVNFLTTKQKNGQCSLSYLHPRNCTDLEHARGTRHLGMTDITSRCGVDLDGAPCANSPVSTCKAMQICGPNLTDGEYWLYPSTLNGRKAKIYCHNMANEDPKEYITLHGDNFSEWPPKTTNWNECNTLVNWNFGNPGKTTFQKIRVNINTMVVVPEDYTFTTTNGKPRIFGEAADCSFYQSNCPRLGKMQINTSDTGLVINRTLQWKLNGYASKMISFKRLANGQVITAVCGGYCGSCNSSGQLNLEVDTTAGLLSSAARNCIK